MSCDLWNLWDIKPPPTCKVKVILKRQEIRELQSLLYKIGQVLKDVKVFNYEAALLSRMLYKSKRMFRHDKGLQTLVKINQCLKRYKKLNMVEVVSDFKKNLPGKIPEGASHIYLPTKQMFQWVLFRFQTFGKLFARMVELGEQAGPQLYAKMCLGWAGKATLCFYGCNARLLALSKYFVLKSIEWYDSLRKFLGCFESTAEFLGGQHQFPRDLKAFLGPVNIQPWKKRSDIDRVLEMIDLSAETDDSEITVIQHRLFKGFSKEPRAVEVVDSDVEEVEVVKEKVIKSSKTEKDGKNASNSEDVDIGVPIGRKGIKGQKQEKKKAGREWMINPYGIAASTSSLTRSEFMGACQKPSNSIRNKSDTGKKKIGARVD